MCCFKKLTSSESFFTGGGEELIDFWSVRWFGFYLMIFFYVPGTFKLSELLLLSDGSLEGFSIDILMLRESE